MQVEFEISSRTADTHISLRLDNEILHVAAQNKFELVHIRKLFQSLLEPRHGSATTNNASSLPLQRRFEVNAQTFPGAPAVKAGGKFLSYGELDHQADELALHLQCRGLRPGSFCLVKLAPSLAEVRVILAILKAGAAYVQFDPHLAPQHEAVVIDVLEPSFLFVHENEAPRPESGKLQVVPCKDEAMELPYGWPDEAGIGPSTPACVLVFTALGEGVCIWMRTHKSLASPERVLAKDSGTTGRQFPNAYPNPGDFWQVLSKGDLLTIPHA
jgi:hypothetical protein